MSVHEGATHAPSPPSLPPSTHPRLQTGGNRFSTVPLGIMRAQLYKKTNKGGLVKPDRSSVERKGVRNTKKSIHLLSTLGARASSPRGESEIPKRQKELSTRNTPPVLPLTPPSTLAGNQRPPQSSPHSEMISMFRMSGGRVGGKTPL